MKKKIAFFASTWSVEISTSLLNGMKDKIQDMDVEIHVFNTYDATEKEDIIPKEQDILYLPDLNQYDGVLIYFNAVGEYPEVEKRVSEYAASGRPVLCIERGYAQQPCIGVGNYNAFYQIVEHLITCHGCKTLNFFGGPQEHPENISRYQAYRDCLEKYNIPFDPDRVYNGHFLRADGPKAYAYWKEKGLHLPDAVVCANDYMALGYHSATEKDGYNAPQDYLLTGFDNISIAQNFTPSITSVNRDWYNLGGNSIAKLMDLINGETPIPFYNVSGRLALNESCGCKDNNNVLKTVKASYYSQQEREVLGIWSRKVLQLLCNYETEAEFRYALELSEKKVGLQNLVLCMNFNKDNPSEKFFDQYTDTMIAYSVPKTIEFSRSELIPKGIFPFDSKLLIFSPLHFGEHNFGYFILPYTETLLQYDKHRKFIDYLCLALNCSAQRVMLEYTNRQLQQLYLTDQLTGLYNRFGFTNLSKKYFDSQSGKVTIYYIDLDNLKKINDGHGHSMGDYALNVISDGIRSIFFDAPLKIRMGGDEFLVIEKLLPEDKIIRKEQMLSTYLHDYQVQNQLKFPLTTSIGHVTNDDANASIEDLVKIADKKMYAVKQSKKPRNNN